MQRRPVCAVVAVALSFSFLLAAPARGQAARPSINVETFYPRHAGPGQTTVISIAVPRGTDVKAAEITPATGVTVSGIKGSTESTEQAIGWWEIALDVAKDALPGDRSLVLVLPMGRTAPITIGVPTHVPSISNLRSAASAKPSSVDLLVAVADAGGDLGESPYVWFTGDCGGDPVAGTVAGKATAGSIRASVPNLRSASGEAKAAGRCDLEVRVTDSAGVESNRLKTTVEFRN